MPSTPALASVSVDRIANAFIAWAEEEPGRYWWWPRDIRLDPDEVIADDGEGNTFRVPFTTDGELAVAFGEPVEVRETFIDVAAPAAAAAAAGARVGQRVLARGLPKPDKPDPSNPQARASAEPDNEVTLMDDDVRQVLERQGLDPETATEEQQQAARVFAQITPPEPTGDPEPELDVAPPATPEPELVPAAAAASDRVATVDRDRLDRLERDAAAGATARREQVTSRLDALAEAAVRDGRITPASRAAWRQAIDPGDTPDPAATARAEAEQNALATLEPGRVPITERGTTGDLAAAAAGQITQTGWFPTLNTEA